ncbi:winged helix-turn-helix transcriptional regulator [Streptomyces hoynatensis]|uniref:HxlR family transcriptional regulator n=1 Tax=Streptomyces hoynatensis TaxID=1141874 RepID=A0A3A9ZBQ1_9ACTN|nr:winged helix-turn-helix transcriptional regulator [Streptomyces hoynatensis]RKN45710.1 HxlR family transcriptional regulator [Streptomyces hoynatensis]
MSPRREADDACGIAQAAAVVGEWWSLLVLREIARGHVRFDRLAQELGVSRKILADRLRTLTAHRVLERRRYQEHPPRYEYLLTEQGRGLLPVLVALQDWADRWLLGDGTLTGLASDDGAEARRVAALRGERVPAGLRLPGTDGRPHDPVATGARATVVFTYPATGVPGAAPENPVAQIPGGAGCTLENRQFRAAWPRFVDAGIAVHGLSTQSPQEQAAFARAEELPFPLLSDAQLQFTAALRLPTFRAGQSLRTKRLILVIGPQRVVRHALFPLNDIPAAVDQALDLARAASGEV